jgi:hypothetical protein
MKTTRIESSPFRRALIVLVAGLWCAAPALADGDRVAELERRVAELEAMVESLIDQRDGAGARAEAAARQASADAADARAQAETAKRQITELDKKVRPVVAAVEEEAAGPKFSYGGYIKTDLIVSDFADGPVSGTSIGRDFFVASTIPVGDGDGQTYVDAHARQTRFHFGTQHTLDNGATLGSYIELDFLATAGGNERVSNSFQPRMRHAFVTYDDWLVGQTWNTFMDVATLPESVDFIGPAGSTSFGREPMIRYSRGGFAVALENPETTVTPLGGGRIETDTNTIPELAARYTWRGDWGHFQVGGMLRQLAFEDSAADIDATETGWGVSVSGKAMLGRDDVRFLVVHGEGLGRQVGLNFANGAALTDTGDLEAIGTTGAFVAYRHWWSQRWRSTAVLSYMEVDNPIRFTGTGVNESNWSGQINLLYSPVESFTFGVEYLTAERTLENGLDGRLDRLQFTGKYAF